MIIRPYTPDDGRFLGEMLLAEGLEPDEMEYVTGETFVAEDNDGNIVGFYTYTIKDVFPYLQHYCVGRENRDGTLGIARGLIRDFKRRTKESGYAKVIVSSFECGDRLDKLINWYFKPKEYAVKENRRFYLATL